MIEFWIKWYKQWQQSCREKENLKKKSKREKKTTRDLTDNRETKIKSSIYMINLTVVMKHSFNICLYQKNCKLNMELIKLFF